MALAAQQHQVGGVRIHEQRTRGTDQIWRMEVVNSSFDWLGQFLSVVTR